MNILFVCKHNRFRSKVAEALFRHHYKGESVHVRSAGIMLDFMHPYMGRNAVHVLRNKGILLRDDGIRKMDGFLLNWADRVIIVADNVAPEYVRNKPVIVWHIKDASEHDVNDIARRIDEIERNVLELISHLK
jgi:protein-tyrosine-phosphatase